MNTPNKLTLIRVLLVPFFIIFFFAKFKYSLHIAVLIFLLASITDSVDGYLARKNNQVTNFGKFMDPLADKLLITAALVCFVEKGYIGSWVAIVIISREFIVTGIRLVAALENKVIEASGWGKIKTISQIVSIILILINSCVLNLNIFNINLISILVFIVVVLTVYSGFDYVRKNWKLIKLNNVI